MVSDMVAAPKRDMIAYLSEGLNCVVLQDETVFSERSAGPNSGFRADIRSQRITFFFGFLAFLGPNLIHLGVTDGNKQVALVRRIFENHVFKSH